MQRLSIDFPPEFFVPTGSSVSSKSATRVCHRAPPRACLNYTLFGYSVARHELRVGLFRGWALGLAGIAGGDRLGKHGRTLPDQTTHQFVRYDTVLRRDDPQGLRTLLLGDSFTQLGQLGSKRPLWRCSIRDELLASTRPHHVSVAGIPRHGHRALHRRRLCQWKQNRFPAVQAGPFTLNGVPLVSGAGDVQLVVRDAFGQQQTLVQPFYASRRLLRGGLDEFQVSAGAFGENYGLDSFDYGSGVGAGYWRRGVNDQFTIEARGEGDANVYAGGLTGDFAVGLLGTLTAGGALSNGSAGSGNLWIAGYEYFGRPFNFAARSFWASRNFRAVGDENLPVVQRQSFVSAGVNFGAVGSLGLAWAAQYYRALPSIDTVALTYTATVVPRVFLTLSISRSYSVIDQTSAFATLNFVLGGRTSAGLEATTTRSDRYTSSYGAWSVQQTLPTDEGFAYRLRSTSNNQLDGGVGYTWRYGTYLLEASRYQGESAARATASGGLGFINGYTFASRPVTESFGLVQVGDIEGVRVFHDGNPVGRTDADGRIVLQRMTPYVANRVTIDDRDLPIDVSISTRELNVAPQFRSGALINYDARRRRSVILEVLGPDGRHLPAGTEVSLADGTRRFTVGEEGEVFIPDMPALAQFIARRRDGLCGFEVRFETAPPEFLAKLGPYQCQRQK